MILLLTALLPLLIIGIIIYNQTTRIFTENIQAQLHTLIQTKNAALEEYIGATESLGQTLAMTEEMRTYIALVNKERTAEEEAQFIDAADRVDNLLFSIQETHWGKYHHVFLIDRQKQIVISPNHGDEERGSPSSHLNENTSTNRWVTDAFLQGVTTVSDFSSWIESDHSHQMLFKPVIDDAGVTQAVIGFELQIPYEQEILAKNVTLGETGRVFLATDSGIPIVYKGIGTFNPLDAASVLKAKQTGSSFGMRENAAGVEVIDVYLKNAKHPWILVAEIEAQEVFGNLRTLQFTIVAGLLATFLLIVGFSVFISNLVVNPIKHLTKQMEDVSLGNLEIQVTEKGRTDEIGQLVMAFTRIVKSLKIAMQGYQGD